MEGRTQPSRTGRQSGNILFGPFELDLRTGELRRDGVRIQLQDQPFQILRMLLEYPGEVVLREEIRSQLWPDDTVVEFEHSINAAVKRLRDTLGDSAEKPFYIETLPRRGYRFVGQVEAPENQSLSAAPLVIVSRGEDLANRPLRRSRPWAAAILISAIAAIAGFWWLTRRHTARSETSLTVTPLTTGSGVERNASFSPDGSQIVYEWARDDGERHLYIKMVGPGDPIPLTSGPSVEYGPAWSPDGRLIAFLRQLDESTMGVFVIPPLGGVERKVTESVSPPYPIRRQFHRRLDWTRDSRHLIVSAPEHAGDSEGLLLVSLDHGEKTWLTKSSADSTYNDREPAVSPDGRTVAFVREGMSGRGAILLLPLSRDMRPAGGPSPLASAGPSANPAWTPDGKQIVYTTPNPAMVFGSGVWTVGLKPGDVPHPLLALGRNAAIPAVARTDRLAYSRVTLESNIWQQEIPSRAGIIPQPVRLTATSAIDSDAQFSPDGSRIAFVSNRSGTREIWTCASDGAHCVQVTNFNSAFNAGTPRWSPDGRQLALDSGVTGQSEVYLVDANGGPPRRLTQDATHGTIPSWSHNGIWIYFSSTATGRNEVWKIPSAGGKAVQVTRNGGYVAFESPDGKALFYSKNEQNLKLWKSAVDGSGESEVLSGMAVRGFIVAVDRIYYLRPEPDGSTGIRRLLLATRVDSQIVSVAKPMFMHLGLSPDGKYLIYSQLREASNLMLVDDIH